MIQSVLTAAGFRVGLYTSPYIQRFNERIRIGEKNISDQELASVTKQIKESIDIMLEEGYQHPTEFEVVTAMALLYYKQQEVDFVILEVGLGGRLDATNVIETPLLCVITPIDYDHMAYLGNTLEAIAGEKAGIIKKGIPIVTGFQQEKAMWVLEEKASSIEAPLTHVVPKGLSIHQTSLKGQSFTVSLQGRNYEKMTVSLPGPHQVENCMLALVALQKIEELTHIAIGQEFLRKGLERIRWMGRLEVVHEKPMVLIDGAHNRQGARALSKSIDLLLKDTSITWLVGMLEDKEIQEVLDVLLPQVQRVVVTQPDYHRAIKAEALAEMIGEKHSHVWVEPAMKKAMDKALEITAHSEVVLCAGSLYMLGQIRSMFLGEETGDDGCVE